MPDILVLEVKPSLDEQPIYIVNVYNAPTGSEQAGKSAETMIGTPELLHKRSLIMGDIDLLHTDWDNRTVCWI